MFEVTKKLVPLAFAVYVLFVPSGLTASAAVDLTTNKEQVQEFYESMLSKRVLLGEEGSEEALQAYYADQQIADQNKRELSVVAQLIDYFTDDVLGDYYQQWINGYLDIPSGGVSSAVLDDSYGQYTGFYKTSADSQPYSCSFKPSASGVIVSSSHFSLSVRWEFVAFDQAGRTYQTKPSVSWNSYGRYEIGSEYDFSDKSGSSSTTCYVYRILEGSGGFASSTGRTQARQILSSSGSGSGRCFVQLGVGTNLPVLDVTNLAGKINASSSNNLASWGSVVKLPEGDLTQEPWDYFNTKFLPWVRGECDSLGFDYTKICPYPDGYNLHHDPVEPAPIVPGLQPSIISRPVYETVEVTDESGNVLDTELFPMTDEQGETVTETIYETQDPSADDFVYEGEFASLPSLVIPTADFPTVSVPAELGSNIHGMWLLISDCLQSSGLMDILALVFIIGLIGFCLSRLV